MIYCCNIAFKLSWRLNSDSVKTEKTKQKKTTANKVFQSFVKGKLWILVYLEQSRITFNFCPQNKGNLISGRLGFKIFRLSMPPDPLEGWCLWHHLLGLWPRYPPIRSTIPAVKIINCIPATSSIYM